MKTILVAVDGSPVAEAVIETAVKQARAFDVKLLLMHAVGIPLELPSEAFVVAPNDVVEVLRRAASRQLEELVARVPVELRGGTMVDVGVPWRAICDVAKERDVEMIIMGAHGHRWSDGLLGTTSSRVINHADRTVMVVRKAEETEVTAGATVPA